MLMLHNVTLISAKHESIFLEMQTAFTQYEVNVILDDIPNFRLLLQAGKIYRIKIMENCHYPPYDVKK